MAKKIFRNTFLVTLIVILVAAMLITLVMYRVFDERMQRELANTTQIITRAFDKQGDELGYLQGMQLKETRITWISADGTVLFDNVADITLMENHAQRPEISQALQIGVGKSFRYSDTLAEKTFYYAMLQKDGTVLRLSSTQQSIIGIILGLLPAIAIISGVVLILSAVLAKRLTRRVLKPINELDLEHPSDNDSYDELSPILHRLHQQTLRINQQMSDLAKSQKELSVITDHMSEGLVMLSSKQHILSINKRAQELFSVTEEACIGKYVLMLSRDKALETVVQRAQTGDNAETMIELNGRVYQLLASPVYIENTLAGTVLLILDITEKSDAERLRREFSANVSHELKTPLTSISGYAEIMKNGVAKPEDMVGFSSRIYDESTRLISLIEDIIKLSKLDEGSIEMERQDVDLYALSLDVAHRLEPLAEQYGVTINVRGEAQHMFGVRSILEEMIHNLCENSVKYNKRGGKVDILVDREDGNPRITVKDNGIGIPPALQEKVFERFYRVDKSHSRASGGTGLGLSIVKHGARYHNARILLTSAVGKGTEVKLVFPSNSTR